MVLENINIMYGEYLKGHFDKFCEFIVVITPGRWRLCPKDGILRPYRIRHFALSR